MVAQPIACIRACAIAETHLEVARHLVCQLFSILSNLVVEVDVGGVLQEVILPIYCRHNLGMTVSHTDCHNPSKGLQTVQACGMQF